MGKPGCLKPGGKLMPSGDSMEAQEELNQGQDGLADGMIESPKEDGASDEVASESEGQESSHDPLYVQKRLKQKQRAHDREMREVHAKMAEMQARLNNQSQPPNQAMNPYDGQGAGMQPGSVEESIHKAVSYALGQKDMEERKAREAQQAAHVNKQYRELHKHLDSMGDKYDDFHDVVLSDDAQFTPAMRDYAMTLPKSGKGSAGEVLYNLGKNQDELTRIANLHPLDQASEMMKLSHALISGGESKSPAPRPLGQIKSNPVSNSHVVTDKTPVSSIRQRMKEGKFR